MTDSTPQDPATDLRSTAAGQGFACILADPPWQFTNRTGKMAPEHKRLSRYGTMDTNAIAALPIPAVGSAVASACL